MRDLLEPFDEHVVFVNTENFGQFGLHGLDLDLDWDLRHEDLIKNLLLFLFLLLLSLI